MAESMQWILVKRGLAGQHPGRLDHIIPLLEGIANRYDQAPRPLSGAASVLPAANEAGSGVLLSVAPELALAIRFAADQLYCKNGSHHAKRPTSVSRISCLGFACGKVSSRWFR